MHELSIADNIINSVKDAALLRGMKSISKIGVRIGSLSSVDPDALTFGFDVLKREQGMSECELLIESIATRAKCRKCGNEFKAEDFVFVCPGCGSSQCDLLSGQELEIAYYEGE
ncbi:MAG: hydrogenase maturation nickel metallochaperone HypA [Candidatus Zixiibacteriota bacterium]